jgi:hypothetical protein
MKEAAGRRVMRRSGEEGRRRMHMEAARGRGGEVTRMKEAALLARDTARVNEKNLLPARRAKE